MVSSVVLITAVFLGSASPRSTIELSIPGDIGVFSTPSGDVVCEMGTDGVISLTHCYGRTGIGITCQSDMGCDLAVEPSAFLEMRARSEPLADGTVVMVGRQYRCTFQSDEVVCETPDANGFDITATSVRPDNSEP